MARDMSIESSLKFFLAQEMQITILPPMLMVCHWDEQNQLQNADLLDKLS